jgi:radical SAM superfamily enzyme YgiQ (UPF0313 family)
MKRGGVKTINLSYVSTDPGMKERMGRPKAKIAFDEILEEAERVGLSVIAYAILGMPGQTIEEMVDTLTYLMGKRVLVGPSIYYPTPGTPLFERCKRDDLLPLHQCQWRSSAFPIETREFSRIDLVTLFRLARVINFIKGKMDKEELEEGLTWEGLYRVLDEKAKAEAKVEEVKWRDLLLMILDERAHLSLRRDSHGRLSVVEEKSSRKVLDCFFEKAWQCPIQKSRSSLVS